LTKIDPKDLELREFGQLTRMVVWSTFSSRIWLSQLKLNLITVTGN